MAAYRCIVIGTPFPLTGKACPERSRRGRDRGAREPSELSPLPLSFPVKGKDENAVVGRVFIGRPPAPYQFSKKEADHEYSTVDHSSVARSPLSIRWWDEAGDAGRRHSQADAATAAGVVCAFHGSGGAARRDWPDPALALEH